MKRGHHLLLVLIIGMMGFCYYQIQRAEKIIDTMEQEVASLEKDMSDINNAIERAMRGK